MVQLTNRDNKKNLKNEFTNLDNKKNLGTNGMFY